jgi:hypothetical protein
MKVGWQIFWTIIMGIASFCAGAYFGHLRHEASIIYETVYLPQDTVRIHLTDTVIYTALVREEVIRFVEVPKYYFVFDTLRMESVIDTAKIVAEFLMRRFYDQVFVDDSTGYIRLKQTVAMNAIQEQELIFVPAPKEITFVRQEISPRTFRFSVGAEYHNLRNSSDLSLRGGVLYKDKFHVNVGLSLDNMKTIGVNVIF